ncbi:replication-relaxation family protein [Bacillus sp. FJAT-49736]|nr:replication-relaxation family protein [Bacillus sp. FJAT-49736]
MKKLDYLNRDQLSKIHRLGKPRNTNRILSTLSPYLSNFREEYSTIYYLNKEGREYVSCNKIRRKTNYVNHIIMRNDFYIYAGFPSNWRNEIKIKLDKYSVTCDALYVSNGKRYCLEVDHKQNMKENKAKINRYITLFKLSKDFPKLIWLTTTENRKNQLKELCKELPCIVYSIDDIR